MPDTPFAPLTIRRDAEIYSTDGGWFKARWHFSFDQHHDPENMGIGTLRVFNHDTLVPGAIWPMHPHRDIEGTPTSPPASSSTATASATTASSPWAASSA